MVLFMKKVLYLQKYFIFLLSGFIDEKIIFSLEPWFENCVICTCLIK